MAESPPAGSAAQHAVEHTLDPARAHPGWATARALTVAVVLSLIVGAWTKQAELVSLTSQISESTPPIASITVLALRHVHRDSSWRADRCRPP